MIQKGLKVIGGNLWQYKNNFQGNMDNKIESNLLNFFKLFIFNILLQLIQGNYLIAPQYIYINLQPQIIFLSKQGLKMEQPARKYSTAVGDAKPGETPVYRCLQSKDQLTKIPKEINSFADIWDICLKKYPQNLLLEDSSFTKVYSQATKVGSWLLDHGFKVMYLYCKNRYQWTITDIACMNYGLINVPLYDTLGQQAFEHILKITQGNLMFTTKDLISKILKLLTKNKSNIKEIVIMGDNASQEDLEALKKLQISVTSFDELLNNQKIIQRPQIGLDQTISYQFTSGTTGIPKGVVMTHRMGIAQCIAVQGYINLRPDDVHMSFLPIAHGYERLMTWLCMYYGTNIRYVKFPITQIMKDLATIRPTVLTMVPRLINRFYPLLKGLSDKEGNFTKVRGMFGGRLRMMITGSAPISAEMLKFFKQALSCIIIEGYGQTQTTAASFITFEDQAEYGHVGCPNKCTEFKLKDVPQMNYYTSQDPPRGEVCIRGESVFKEYFKDPENTKEVLDSQRWNFTGDIGVILPNGALKIIDRKKNIFKLQQGEYLAPQKIENIYSRCKYITQSFVSGNSLETYCVAIVHPNMDALPMIAANLGIQEKDPEALCKNKAISDFILDEINKQGRKDGLVGFQLAKKIALWPKPFALMGVVTSTMKLQRHLARKVFQKQIQQLYLS